MSKPKKKKVNASSNIDSFPLPDNNRNGTLILIYRFVLSTSYFIVENAAQNLEDDYGDIKKSPLVVINKLYGGGVTNNSKKLRFNCIPQN